MVTSVGVEVTDTWYLLILTFQKNFFFSKTLRLPSKENIWQSAGDQTQGRFSRPDSSSLIVRTNTISWVIAHAHVT